MSMFDMNLYDYQFSILGTMIIYKNFINVCVLDKKVFAEQLQPIFQAIKKLYAEDGDILLEKLALMVDFDLVNRCTDSFVSSDQERFNQLQRHAILEYKKRQVVDITNNLNLGHISLEEFDSEYRKISDNQVIKTEKLTAKMLIDSCMNSANDIRFTRFKTLNEKLKLYEKDFLVLAGGTAVGKTALALNLLQDLSMRYECLYFNLEMSDSALHKRLIAVESHLPIERLKGYQTLGNETVNQVNAAINRLVQNNISVENGSKSIEQIRNIIASQNHEKHTIVFIDHIGLVKFNRAKSSYERATEVAKELRRICLDYNCTIIGLCQLSRIQKEDVQPRLSMLRDSGEIEQSARKVMFIWKTENYGDEKYYMIIEKNDSNAKGKIEINYDKQIQKISEKI